MSEIGDVENNIRNKKIDKSLACFVLSVSVLCVRPGYDGEDNKRTENI